MLTAKLKSARKFGREVRAADPRDRRSLVMHELESAIFPRGGRDLSVGRVKIMLISVGTTSGVERRARIGRYAAWDVELRVWRAG